MQNLSQSLRHVLVHLTVWSLALMSIPQPPTALAQTRPDRRGSDEIKGKTVMSWREESPGPRRESQKDKSAADGQSKQQRPVWVENALRRSYEYLDEQIRNALPAGASQRENKQEARNKFELLSAEEDDLGLTHVRLKQLHQGLPVFGGQIVTHLDNERARPLSGNSFEIGNVKTTPTLTPEEALQKAKEKLGYSGKFSREPQVELMLLPHAVFKEVQDTRVTLVYRVELPVEDGSEKTGLHQYFVDARDGSVVWYYDNLMKGTGHSVYSGDVQVASSRQFVFGSGLRFVMQDFGRGGMFVTDMNNSSDLSVTGMIFIDNDDIWGDVQTNNNRQSAAVDAHHGAALTWDYFLSGYGRRGIDGNGYRLRSRVHWGVNIFNAAWNGVDVTYGDGFGAPLVTVDIVGHEITHGLTENTADLIYAKESGALNESFSDIFGAMVEQYSGLNPDYLIGEDTGSALRSMSNPAAFGDPDHYSKRIFQANCSPNGFNDNCGVHSNSGVSNNAFYLLAEGGANATSGISVPAIGRDKAERIFYRALTVYLSPTSKFIDARNATLRAAADLYPASVRDAVAKAWDAVGVEAYTHVATGDFNGDGRAETLSYARQSGDWLLGTYNIFRPQLQWAMIGNTKGARRSDPNFGEVWDGRPVWFGNFSRTDRTEALFYYPGDDNWWLGTFDGSQLTWSFAGNTAGFGHAINDGRPFWTGDFNGDGRKDVLFYSPWDDNWWLGTHQGPGGQLVWKDAGNTIGFGHAINDGRPFWIGNFSRADRDEVLFYFPGDDNWWLGTFDGSQFVWSFAGNTIGFGHAINDGRPFWTGDFNGDSRKDILFYFHGDDNWWLGTFKGSQLTWSHVGNTVGFGHAINDGRPFWIGNFSRADRDEVLFYFPGDDNWWLGTYNGSQLVWGDAGNTVGFGHNIYDGRPFWINDFNGDSRKDVMFYFPGDGAWWLGLHPGPGGKIQWRNVGSIN
ncbi:MAG TPA: M4 family metallopeptidase [Blastocatellia bacterium]|nr:M4 family metallopeptidase [Blastocatellia bacterium]